ncbi:hypothetical protein J437_LFUL007710 [Ladona fulva]|uniref:N-acyl-aliphatic-L-amino acid amidohydrolase n=1 Tax=Ladona fulva TaxID=123851 RepID=A0A8K0K7I1_LADFU|nr:hypothetical protein J437_LFUL007710 [Ladona fulva]
MRQSCIDDVLVDMWTHDPFSAHKDANGNIYARGSQDMKCVGIQYIEAVKRLKSNNIQLKRTIHMSFMPDEEIGGTDGMKKFVRTEDFRKLNVGFALDEGIASPTEEFLLYNNERSVWKMTVHCPGTPGHGSLLLNDTAGEKLRVIIDRFMDFRQKEKEKLLSNPKFTIGDVTTINLTMLMGGVEPNVVPPELEVTFDVRLALDVDHNKFQTTLETWCAEAGPGTTITFISQDPKVPTTAVDDTNPWWRAFKKETDALGLKLKPLIFPGGTDCRYIREVGIPALGFSPMNNTPVLLHDHDEFLNEKVFLKGIEIYQRIIPTIANV